MLEQKLKHNKKRNVGLINEFFTYYIAEAVIDKRDGDLLKAKNILKKYFHKDTNLHKEIKLFNTLYKTKINNKEAAYSMINKIKDICKLQSQQTIELEKTALLHEINSQLNDTNFFNKDVENYKIFATIQVLLNSWRMNNLQENISETSQLEDKLLEFIINKEEQSKKQIIDNVLNMTNEDINQLVVNIMLEKLNNKFGSTLLDEQKKIINLYVFSDNNENMKLELVKTLEEVKNITENLIEKEISNNDKDVYINDKLIKIKEMIKENKTNMSQLTDENVSFYLYLTKLVKELSNASS